MDWCPLTSGGHEVMPGHFPLPVLIALWVACPRPLRGMYIHRQEYAANLDDEARSSPAAADVQATLSWAVKFRTGAAAHRTAAHRRTDYDETAARIAGEVGLLNHGQVGELLNHYLFVHASYNATLNGTEERDAARRIQGETETRLRRHPDVEWFHQQRIRRRTKRSVQFHDPSYSIQWHLHNHASPGMDINVTEVWNHNITGTGVVVAVIDDGLEWRNEDILANYNAKGSWDLNNNDPDPMPEVHKDDGKSLNRHGTRCAGEIAAVANDKCAVGVAFNAQISGIRLLDGPMTDSLEATAFNKNMHINDIYSCSWGPDDDGKTVDGPHPLAQAALKHGVTAGRRGLGSVFVVASGNGGRNEDNCNYDGYANSMYTVTIGAVDESGQMPYYAEQCASMLAVTFSSGAANKRNIVTTDWTLAKGTGCTSSHTGTSAAAPLAAGMIALMLQAKPCLSWRDVQHLIVYTAVKIDQKNAVWDTNAGGFHHSHKHGFGLMSAWRLVNAAKSWHTVPWLTSVDGPAVTENAPIRPGETLTVTQKVSNSTAERNELRSLEHVLVTVSLTHAKRGSLEVRLICPSGTKSVIGAQRKKDESSEGLKSWTFSTVRCWGENPVGEWTLDITDYHLNSFAEDRKGKLQSWKLTLYGSNMNRQEIEKRKTLVSEAMSGIFLDANLSEPCSYYWNAGYEDEGLLSPRVMEAVLYMSGVFTLMAIYYTLEQAFCNSEDKDRDKDEGGGAGSEDLETGPRSEERTHLLEEYELETLDEASFCPRSHRGRGRNLTDPQSVGDDVDEVPGDRGNMGDNGGARANLRGGDQNRADGRNWGLCQSERETGDGESDEGTLHACQNKRRERDSKVIRCHCEALPEVHLGAAQNRNSNVTPDDESDRVSIRTHCPGCRKSQVQYNGAPPCDGQSVPGDSRARLIKEVPSHHAFHFDKRREVQARPTAGATRTAPAAPPLVALNGCQSSLVGSDSDEPSSPNASTAEQFSESGTWNSATRRPGAETVQTSLEASHSLDDAPGHPFTQPIPSGLLLSTAGGLGKPGPRMHLIGPSGSNPGDNSPPNERLTVRTRRESETCRDSKADESATSQNGRPFSPPVFFQE